MKGAKRCQITKAVVHRAAIWRDSFEEIRIGLRRTYMKRGLLLTATFILGKAISCISGGAIRGSRDPLQAELDTRLGIDTAGVAESQEPVEGENGSLSIGYQPSPPGIILEVLEQLPIDYSQFTFVDVGCGKGLAVLLASRYPFKRVRGVDFSARLISVANENLLAGRDHLRRCTEIDFVCADILSLPPHSEPTVYYLFNPFRAPVLDKFVRQLDVSLRQSPRSTYIVYYYPAARRILDTHTAFKVQTAGPDYLIYRWIGGDSAEDD